MVDEMVSKKAVKMVDEMDFYLAVHLAVKKVFQLVGMLGVLSAGWKALTMVVDSVGVRAGQKVDELADQLVAKWAEMMADWLETDSVGQMVDDQDVQSVELSVGGMAC